MIIYMSSSIFFIIYISFYSVGTVLSHQNIPFT